MKMPRSTFAATAVTLGSLVIGAFAGAVLAQGADQTVMTPSGPIHIKRPDVRVLEATDKKDSTFSGGNAVPFVEADVLTPPAAGVDGDPIFEGAVMFRPKVSRFGYINDEGFYIGFAREYQAPTFQSGNSSATGALQFELTRQGKAHAMSFPNPNPETSSRALHFIDDVRFITDSGHVMRPNYTMSTLAVPPNSRDPYNASGNPFITDPESRLMDFVNPELGSVVFSSGHASSITRRLVLEGSDIEKSVTYGGNRYEIAGNRVLVNGVETSILSERAGTVIDLFTSGADLYILTDRGALLAALNDPSLTSIEAVRMPSATGAVNRVRMVFARANFPTIPGPAPIDTPCVLLEDNTAVCRPDGATLDWVGAPRGQINPRLYGDRHNTVTYNEATNEVTGLRAAGLALNVQMPRGVTGSPTRAQGLIPESVVAIQHFAAAEERTSGSNPDVILGQAGAAGRRHEEYVYCGRLVSAPDRVGCMGGELGDSLLPSGHVHAAGELEYELLDYRYRLPSPGETVKMLCSHGGTITRCSRVSDLVAGNIAPVLTINRQAGARPIHRSTETSSKELIPHFGFNETTRRFVQATSAFSTQIPQAVGLPRWTTPTTITWAPPTTDQNSPAGLYLNNVSAFYNQSQRRLTGLLRRIPRPGQLGGQGPGVTTPWVITYPAATTLSAIRDGYALTSANELRCAPQLDYLGGGHMSAVPLSGQSQADADLQGSSLYPCAGFVTLASNTRLDWVRKVDIHIRPQAYGRTDIPSLPRVEFTRVEMLVGKLQGQRAFRGLGRFWTHESSTGQFVGDFAGRSAFNNIDFTGTPMTYNPWTIVDAEGIVHYY